MKIFFRFIQMIFLIPLGAIFSALGGIYSIYEILKCKL